MPHCNAEPRSNFCDAQELTWLAEWVRILAAPAWAAVQVPPFPLWALLAYYAAVAALWAQRHGREGSSAGEP